jgi:HME family heavy-metal exporter
MLNAVIRFSLRYRMLIVVISLAVLVYGTYLATTLPIDVFPDLDRPRVIIITECPGLATEEVETLVTQPIETALLGANGVQAVRSQTTAGLNVIYIEFDWTTDIRAARQTVQERLATLVMPEGVLPQMTPPSSIMGQIVIAGIYRQPGPSGGTLVPLEGTPLMAELVASDGAPSVKVWQPTDIGRTPGRRSPPLASVGTRRRSAYGRSLRESIQSDSRSASGRTRCTSHRRRSSSFRCGPSPNG